MNRQSLAVWLLLGVSFMVGNPPLAADEAHPPTLAWRDLDGGKIADGTTGYVWFAPAQAVGAINAPPQDYTLKRVHKVELRLDGGLVMEPTGVASAWIRTNSRAWNWPILRSDLMYGALVRYVRHDLHGLVVRSVSDGVGERGPRAGDVVVRIGETDFEAWSAMEDLVARLDRVAAAPPMLVQAVIRRDGVTVPVQWTPPEGAERLGLVVEEVPAHEFHGAVVGNVGYHRRTVTDSVISLGAHHIPLSQCRLDKVGAAVASTPRVGRSDAGIRVSFDFSNRLDRPVLLLGATCAARVGAWEAEVTLHTVSRGHIPLDFYLPPGAGVGVVDADMRVTDVPPGDLSLDVLEVNYAEPEGEFDEVLRRYKGFKPKVSVKVERKRKAPPTVTLKSEEPLHLGVVLRVEAKSGALIPAILPPGALVDLGGTVKLPTDLSGAKVVGTFIPAKGQAVKNGADISPVVYVKRGQTVVGVPTSVRRP